MSSKLWLMHYFRSECFCGENEPPSTSKIANSSCDMKCPGDTTKSCGGYFTMNVYETGLESK